MFDPQRTAVQAEVIIFRLPHDLVRIVLQIDSPCPVCVMQYLFRLFRRYTVLRNDPFQACLPVSVEINMKRIGSV